MHRRRQGSRNRPRQSAKPSISIIGAGRLGTALGIALKEAGYQINLVVAKHPSSARRAAQAIGGATVSLTFSQLKRRRDLIAQSPIIIIATPDDAIAPVAKKLAAILESKHSLTGKVQGVALHTSGALSSEVLQPLQRSGFATGSLHPLVSISDPRSGADWLRRTFFSLEGGAAAIRMGRRLVRELGGQSFAISADLKPLYHAAALMASPNVTALFDVALEMLNRCGLPPTRAREVLLPLVSSTLENLSTQNPSRALTGTFKRRDVATVRKHIVAMESQKLHDALAAYVVLGRRSLSLAKAGANPRTNEIERLLTRASRSARRQS